MMNLVRRQGRLKHRKRRVPGVHEHFEHSANKASGSKAHFERTSGIFKGIDITLITILSIMVAGILGLSGVLIWLVATL